MTNQFNKEHIIIKSIFPFKIGIFGIYQHLFSKSLGKLASNDDIVFILTGYPTIPRNKNQKVFFINQNAYGSTEPPPKYQKGFWKYYFKPYQNLMKQFHKNLNLQENLKIISISKHAQTKLLSDKNLNSTVIYPPVNINEFQNNHEKVNRVITVGRYSPEKNIDFFIKIMNHLTEPGIIIGTASKQQTRYYNKLQSLAQKNISLFCNIPRSQMLDFMKRSKVYFHAGLETFGFTVIEAMASGCIPIVPDNSAHQETVPFDELRYDPENFTDALTKIKHALKGSYDYYKQYFPQHLRQFSKENFKNSFNKLMEKEILINE